MRWRPVAVLLFLSAFVHRAEGGVIQIDGLPALEFSGYGDTVLVRGSIDLANNGDEIARHVFPMLELGSWRFAGHPRDLRPRESANWPIDQAMPNAKLRCAGDPSCGGLELPTRGEFPLFMRRHYEDSNGKSFSAPEVIIVTIGLANDEERTRLQIPQLELSPTVTPKTPLWNAGRLDWKGTGLHFSISAELRNLSSSARTIATALFTSRELQIASPPQVLEIGPLGTAEVSAVVNNASALPGSTYPIFIIGQWNEDGLRSTVRVHGLAPVTRADRTPLLFLVLAVFVIALCVLLYFSVFRSPAERRSCVQRAA